MRKKTKRNALVAVIVIIVLICGLFIANYYKSYKRIVYSKDALILKSYNGTSTSKNFIHNNESIPVLMYHSIPDASSGNIMEVSKGQFEEEMKYLKDNGYHTLSADEFYDFIVKDKPVLKKSVLITFDDGYENQYKNAYPVLKKYKFNAVMFIITDYLDKGTLYLKSNELKTMSDNGISIESHTTNHAKLDKLSYKDQFKTLRDSQNKLEGICNKAVRFIAYPYGYFNKDTVEASQKSGYIMAFTTSGKWANINKGVYAVNRIYIFPQFNLGDFKSRITNPNYPQLVHPIDMLKGAYKTFIK
ncbi:polysaccharide deacetylase family protein [Clostridium neuense]|uniref:Polysaccharide deacetylase family protein n=1 Tax=Clostridium neuense TaxID=1728934 RepID=A0ABW8THL7_9CLOT